MSANATAPVDLAPLAAPLLLGSLFNWALFGVLSVQIYLYHVSFPKDSLFAKSLVYGVYLLDTAQTFIVTSDVYQTYAKHYGDLDQLSMMHNEWLAVPIFSGIVSCTVQIYYAYRIGHLSGSRMLMGTITTLALLQGTSAVATGIRSVTLSFKDLEIKLHSSTIIWLAGSAACDVLIAAVMAYLLLRKDVQSIQTRAIISRLVRLVVETGTLTATAATLMLILYVALPHRAYFSTVGAILAKLYANSLLVLFNSRIRIAGSRNWPSHARGVSSDESAAHTARVFSPRRAAMALGGVHIQEQVVVHADESVRSFEMTKYEGIA
ncbi:hypothetical protein PHLGIDRAFT_124345 [Phlebiopsis gigantea 11061_1 CR5-6]|uniref:DUF6534 domain-containing protein n=1 Tax=Phlebiopsis gigantea (strain 11061_1 CR5-6) TaxID=745531 RepID=A0A0C3PW49_PHLG1|nr:hypothetical protein PHLGIDRAFT_124345 [Phlebiopsis gigantea 11061_1 CR5-6]